MIGKLKIIVATFIAMPMLFGATAFAVANSNPLNAACQTNQKTRNSPACQQGFNQGTTNPVSGPGGIISEGVSIIAIVAGIAAVIMIVLSGFAYITAGGNTEGAATARRRLVGSAIGLAIIVLSWSIVHYVTDHVIK